MSAQPTHFAPLARLLHWLMALMILSMLFIGAGMAASVSERHQWLIQLHKPLGVAILLLVIVRLAVRFSTRQPPLPADLPAWQAFAAKASHALLYALMLILPLLGWAMISAAGDPVMLSSSLQLPIAMPERSAYTSVAPSTTRRILWSCWDTTSHDPSSGKAIPAGPPATSSTFSVSPSSVVVYTPPA